MVVAVKNNDTSTFLYWTQKLAFSLRRNTQTEYYQCLPVKTHTGAKLELPYHAAASVPNGCYISSPYNFFK